jgi:hypothetical protein
MSASLQEVIDGRADAWIVGTAKVMPIARNLKNENRRLHLVGGPRRVIAKKRGLGGGSPRGSNGPTPACLDQVAGSPQSGDRRLQPLGPRPERVAHAFDGLLRYLGALRAEAHQRLKLRFLRGLCRRQQCHRRRAGFPYP